MKRIFLLALIITVTISASAQYKFLYYLTADFASADLDHANFIGKGNYEDGLLKLDCFSKVDGSLLMSVHFKDSSLSDFHGLFESYYPNGKTQMKGDYDNNLEAGSWNKWDTLGNHTDSIIYLGGNRILSYKYIYYENNKLDVEKVIDSLRDTYTETIYNEDGTKLQEVAFKGNAGMMNEYDSTGKIKSTPLFTREIKEASFPKESYGFRKFLEQNLKAVVPALNNAPNGSYTVVVRFIVNKDGSLSDFTPETHLGYGMEEEVLRILKISPRWIPAERFGKPVKAIRRQPITFVVDEGSSMPEEVKSVLPHRQ